MSSLKAYHHKRDFHTTHEPKGKIHSKKSHKLYVIQKHAARHLHYDLRLELNGVLKSWAVPKGPSKDPKVKRLAIEVEDHPLEYGSFAGTIPKGQYGAGKVTMWDSGTWQCVDSPQKAYRNGDITFEIFGKKLHGLWKLIKIKSAEKPQWLLMKIHDPLKLHQHGKRATRQTQPTYIKPQLATRVDTTPETKQWLHEVKYDGYRIIAVIKKGEVKLFTRNKQNWTNKLANIAQVLQKITVDCVLDGEVISLAKGGVSNFEILQNEIHNPDSKNLQYKIFDIMHYDGQNLMSLPLIERKAILDKLFKHVKSAIVSKTDYITGKGSIVFKKACKLGLEGIISKQMDSVYEQRRTQTWVKSKCVQEEEYVIAGFTRPRKSRKYFGALLLGYYQHKKLIYCGHVGTGFTEKTLASLYAKMQKHVQMRCPFEHIPTAVKREKIVWIKPTLVAEIKYANRTQQGLLRAPSFLGLRLDKSSKEVKLEMTQKNLDTMKNGIPLTHAKTIIKATQSVTKEQIADYYAKISRFILPYLKDRPLSLLRCPATGKECFFQKNFTTKNVASLEKVIITERAKKMHYLCVNNKTDLLYLMQAGVLELHPWGSQKGMLEKPDIITFDLDPAPDVEWKQVVAAAFYVRDVLKTLGLKSFVKTTGGKGLHVVVPIKPQYTWSKIKSFTKALAINIAKMQPDVFTATVTKAKRKHKIYLDYLRNAKGATAVAAYSLRARPDAPISMPVSWRELKKIKSSKQFTIANIGKHMARLRANPWKGFFQCRQSLKRILGEG